jgi:hypothetical protein
MDGDLFKRKTLYKYVNVFVDSQNHLQGYIPYQYVLDSRNYLQVLITVISI